MKRILLFGGSFDPIHQGHITMVQEVTQLFPYDEVWFILARKARWKSHQTSIKHRKAMLNLAIKGFPLWKHKNVEINRTKEKVSFTIDTVRILKDQYPTFEFDFLIGADSLIQLPEWKDIDQLSKLITFVVVPRDSAQIDEGLVKKYHVKVAPVKPFNTASREIRNLGEGQLTTEVQDYISSHGLYLDTQVAPLVKPSRFAHIISVTKVAKKLAIAHDESPTRAYIAAMLHDCAKDFDLVKARQILTDAKVNHSEVPDYEIHALLGSWWAQTRFHILDEEILSSIRCHVVAKPAMTKFEKILFCADKIEPRRNYDTKPLINHCLANLEEGFLQVLWDNYLYLKKTFKAIPKEYLPALRYYFPKEVFHEV